MHFIFLGPGETGSWDAALFWTQLGLAIAAATSPFVANWLANRRERRASRAANFRMEEANRAAMEREEVAHERARQRSIGERRSYSRAIFFAVQAEAELIKDQLDRAWDFWNNAQPSQHVAGEYLIQLPPIMGKPEVWTRIVIRQHLIPVIELLKLVQEYNQEVEKVSGYAVHPIGKQTIKEIVEILDSARDANAEVVLIQPTRGAATRQARIDP